MYKVNQNVTFDIYSSLKVSALGIGISCISPAFSPGGDALFFKDRKARKPKMKVSNIHNS
jgi:hypothetical protein